MTIGAVQAIAVRRYVKPGWMTGSGMTVAVGMTVAIDRLAGLAARSTDFAAELAPRL